MGFKKWGKEISFADLAVSKSLEHNRSLKMMMSIENVVRWRDVEALLLEHYETGTSNEGRRVSETMTQPADQLRYMV